MTGTNKHKVKGWLFFLLFLPVTLFAQEQFRVANVFGDNMILQRNANVAVWGWDNPGQAVNVKVDGIVCQAVTGEDGKWMARLPFFRAGGPHSLEINGSGSAIFDNILFGDVWLASGQSNMEWSIASGVDNKDEEISSANYPEIRQIKVPRALGYEPKEDIPECDWKLCSPETVPGFSAVAYFFARNIYETHKVPIGIINSSWGGTAAEAWTSREMLKTLPDFRGRLLKDDANPDNWEVHLDENKKNEDLKWEIVRNSKQGIASEVHTRNYNDSNWETIDVSAWGKRLKGVLYMRKTVNIPKSMKGKDLELVLGRVEEKDDAYFNGVRVGGKQDPNVRVYEVDGKLVKSGKNVVVVRVVNPWSNRPRMTGPADVMEIRARDGNWRISLAGEWKYHDGLEPEVPNVVRYQDRLASLYNGMIHPLIPYTITGTIWYQGEGNAGRAYQYRDLFKAMITDWRVRWDAGYFPFLFVQLANWQQKVSEPGPSDWAELREAQLMALDLPNTGMGVIIDIGHPDDIHPKNKQDVGKRLALAARYMVNSEKDLVYSGPVYKNMKIEEGKAVLSFNHIGSGLKSKGAELVGFEIAGADKKFYWADARIVGGQVRVWSDQVKNPVSVRYGWANNPTCNLYNEEDLPATPFRTDDWPGITINRK